MNRNFFLIAALCCCISCGKPAAENRIDLSGEWRFALDRNDEGIANGWYNSVPDDAILLPGSLQEQGFGDAPDINTEWTGGVADRAFFDDPKYARFRESGNFKIPFWLQPLKHYVGPAWYVKDIDIPGEWEGGTVFLHLERPHWVTTVYMDGVRIGQQSGLGMPHVYELRGLGKGGHRLALRVDNRMEIPVGINAHSISDHTQTNWNGITGDIYLEVKPTVYVNHVAIYPDVAGKKIRVVAEIVNDGGAERETEMAFEAKAVGKRLARPSKLKKTFRLERGLNTVETELGMGDAPLLWDEFTPNLYSLTVRSASGDDISEKSETFGMREIRSNGRRFDVNGIPVFLRGTLECCIFPLTGYPSMDPAYWEKIFRTVKAHGLNHVRFHSWCPPRAAFDAADREGVYLQAECSVWANVNIGDGEYIDQWIYAEGDRILREYGNHPSFCLMAHGNEPSGPNQVAYLSGLVDHWQKQDDRRVYTSAGGWPFVDNADYWNAPDPRIHWWAHELESVINAEPPRTDFDFAETIRSKPTPTVSHEIGQWCAYPNFREIEKYTGVLRANNFEIFQQTLAESGLGDMSEKFLMASGKLQTLCYKADIEAALRTPEFAGFQLLDLHDFPGQGTALVGVLDAFWDSKGYVTPQEYSAFCNGVVPLARMGKLIWGGGETFSASVEAAQFTRGEVKNAEIHWSVADSEGNVLQAGSFRKDLPVANCIQVGNIEFPLNGIRKAERLSLSVSIPECKAANSWSFWVYPPVETDNGGILVTDRFDRNAELALESGRDVLLTLKPGALRNDKGGAIRVGFSTIFWNTAWTLNQAPHTLGIYCDPAHPALGGFPTDYHSDYQWWELVTGSNAMVLDDFPADFRPIVYFIDDWFKNRKLGLVWEANVGAGKLVVAGSDLLTDIESRLAAKQMKHSLLEYMKSGAFNPSGRVDAAQVKALLK